jgi:hypothetical protein
MSLVDNPSKQKAVDYIIHNGGCRYYSRMRKEDNVEVWLVPQRKGHSRVLVLVISEWNNVPPPSSKISKLKPSFLLRITDLHSHAPI